MNLEVHISQQGQTRLVGLLHTSDRGSSVSFEYASEWLARPDSFSFDPASLPLRPGAQHSSNLFGAMHDCGPDRWGRILIERAVRKKIILQKPYQDIDYVLAMDDATRLGSLRFRISSDHPFLAIGTGTVPPIIRLQSLMQATEAIHKETETTADLKFLLGVGSPLGGARPKSAVSLPDGRLGIAKFPKPDDIRDIAAGEILALTLASKAGIQVAEHQLVSIANKSVSVITRFDRREKFRIPFISATSLMGLSPGESGTYTQLADTIRQFGDNVAGDLREMWRRLLFSLLISNFDDHLRNHGFLMLRPGKWTLSPAYDINPVPKIDRVCASKTPVSEDFAESTVEVAMSVAARFGVDSLTAKAILNEVFISASNWRKTGTKLRFKNSTLSTYASAFDHHLMDEARRMVKG